MEHCTIIEITTNHQSADVFRWAVCRIYEKSLKEIQKYLQDFFFFLHLKKKKSAVFEN